MVFKKYNPSKPYRHLIAYFWTLKSTDKDIHNIYRFVPDGYVDWVFHLGDPWHCNFPQNKNIQKAEKFHVFGQIKKHVDLDISNGKIDLFGVKFYPWVAKHLWKIDMHYLTDVCLSLTDLDLSDMKFLQEQVISVTSIKDRMKCVESYFRPNLNYNENESLKPVLNAITKDKDLNNFNVGLRRIEQRFRNEIGIPPKLFSRTLRINKTIEVIKNTNELSLTQLALESEFYDQSHFIKDFKQFTGYSPRKFLRSINPDGEILNLRAG